jgi:spoIIIJ-associated protein
VALTRFVEAAADRARAEGTDVVLDVMNGVDRKVVHDTVATLDGVESISEGEDPRRRVVIRPA